MIQKNTLIKSKHNGRITGYIVLWGGPSNKDLQGEFFTPGTRFNLKRNIDYSIVYYHALHGISEFITVGHIDTLVTDCYGIWVEGHLDLTKQFVPAIYKLIDKNTLYWSSCSLIDKIEIEDSGRIISWPLEEVLITPTPSSIEIV